jgi:hypothetical protein
MALTRLRNGGGKVVTWVCRHREADKGGCGGRADSSAWVLSILTGECDAPPDAPFLRRVQDSGSEI